jgi:hypothetical protein
MMTIKEIEAICAVDAAPAQVPHPLDTPDLSLRATFFPMGFPLEVRTNAPEILEMSSRLWAEFTQQYEATPAVSEVYVADGGVEECPAAPQYRFQRPLLVSIADPRHYTVIDMERCRTFTSITRASLMHRLYLEFFFLMMPLSTLPARGMHAACVASNGHGVMLCGDSGAGKSTLAYACARAGWEYISDDGCLLIDGLRRIVAGNCHQVRFRPAAREFFPEIRGQKLTPRAGGKPSIELSIALMPHLKHCLQTRIDFIVFLNRREPEPAGLVPYRKEVARIYLQQGLYASKEAENQHAQEVEHLLEAPVFELRYGDLDWAIERLHTLVEEGR